MMHSTELLFVVLHGDRLIKYKIKRLPVLQSTLVYSAPLLFSQNYDISSGWVCLPTDDEHHHTRDLWSSTKTRPPALAPPLPPWLLPVCQPLFPSQRFVILLISQMLDFVEHFVLRHKREGACFVLLHIFVCFVFFLLNFLLQCPWLGCPVYCLKGFC